MAVTFLNDCAGGIALAISTDVIRRTLPLPQLEKEVANGEAEAKKMAAAPK